ncbi:MAG: thiaminase II [Bryobacterales bacterium]|jgi:thiaminase/transcriptional activator TenA|nr:thiaminase II [Bryobacterales bacterium]
MRRLLLTAGLMLGALVASAQQAPFTRQLWAEAEPVYQATLRHPFLTGLADGSLPRQKFRYYLVQDALYLRAFGQALSLLAAKAPREEWAITLNQHAIETLQAERQLHASILAEGGISADAVQQTTMAPVNAAYTNHLLATVSQRPFVEGLAAVLPCYWVYLEVGKHLVAKGSPDKDYQRWINQYAGTEFEKNVQAVLEMMNQTAATEGADARGRAVRIYERSTRYEYLFWDMAWREERWTP